MYTTSKKEAKRVFVLGALGAGKSTSLNIISAAGMSNDKVRFVASNSLEGCTQDFKYDFIPLLNGEQIQLIDSPGLADPSILIDVWVSKYNTQIAEAIGGIDLVVVVIEYAERPSAKEYQVFAVLNQALKAIKSENLIILFNKCPEQTEQEDAKDFYEACCGQIKTESKFPTLQDNNFLVLRRVGKVGKRMNGNQLLVAQQEVNNALQHDLVDFVLKNLEKVKTQVKPNAANRVELAQSFMDEQTKKDIQEQQKQFEEQKEKFDKQLQEQQKLFEFTKKEMEKKQESQQKALDDLSQVMKKSDQEHKAALKASQHKSEAEIEKIKQQQEKDNKAIQEEFIERMEEERRQSDAKIQEMERVANEAAKSGSSFPIKEITAIAGIAAVGFGLFTANPIAVAVGTGLLKN